METAGGVNVDRNIKYHTKINPGMSGRLADNSFPLFAQACASIQKLPFELQTELRDGLIAAHVKKRTEYSLETFGKLKLARRVVLGYPTLELNRNLKELQFVRERMQKLDDPIQEGTWQDIAESWFSMLKLLQKVKGERVRAVMEAIALDRQLMMALQYLLHSDS